MQSSRMLRWIHHPVAWAALRIWQSVRVALYRVLSTNRPRGTPVLHQPVHFTGSGTIEVQPDVHFGVYPSPSFVSTYSYVEARNRGASVRIGSGTYINNNFCLIAEHCDIRIGTRCLIGANVDICDSDFHGLDPAHRMLSSAEWARPVSIGDNVFIGSHVKVLKGVSIGNDSVIAAGAIVTSDIPEATIAGGNPARVLRSLR
jgi:acetyltransferase-like isoleucine patch superfamily enzyme